MLNPNDLLQFVACKPLVEIQRARAQRANGWPVIHGSWRGTVSAGWATFTSLNTRVPSWKDCEVEIWNW